MSQSHNTHHGTEFESSHQNHVQEDYLKRDGRVHRVAVPRLVTREGVQRGTGAQNARIPPQRVPSVIIPTNSPQQNASTHKRTVTTLSPPPNFHEMIQILLSHHQQMHTIPKFLSNFTANDFLQYVVVLKRFYLLLDPCNLKQGVAQRRTGKYAISDLLTWFSKKKIFWCDHWHSRLGMCKFERLAFVARGADGDKHVVNEDFSPHSHKDSTTSSHSSPSSPLSQQQIEKLLSHYDKIDPHLLIHKFRSASLSDGCMLTFFILKMLNIPQLLQMHPSHPSHDRSEHYRKEVFHYIEMSKTVNDNSVSHFNDTVDGTANHTLGTLIAVYTGQITTQYARVDVMHNFRIAQDVYRVTRPAGRIMDLHLLFFPNESDCFYKSVDCRVKTKRVFAETFAVREIDWERHAE